MIRCLWCHRHLPEHLRTRDHLRPKAMGPGLWANRTAPACSPCNGQRGQVYAAVRQASDWAAGRGRPPRSREKLAAKWAAKGFFDAYWAWREREWERLGFTFLDELDAIEFLMLAGIARRQDHDGKAAMRR